VKYNLRKIVTIAMIASFVIFSFSMAIADEDITLKSAPYKIVNKKYQPQDAALVDFLAEGFESWYPAGWTRTITNAGYTWFQASYEPQEGSFDASIEYDPALVPQNEWMISPVIDLSAANPGLELSFWFLTSYYWHVSPNDNGDQFVVVSTDGGETWSDRLWQEDDYGVFENWTWYEVILNFDAYIGESNFKVAFVYQGQDGAQSDFDAILLSDGDAPLDHDVAAVEILAPIGSGDAGVPVTPEVVFANYGGNTETFTVNLTIATGGSDVYDEDFDIVGLAGYGASQNVTFPDFTPAAEAVYDVAATAVLATDQNTANNDLDATYTTIPISGFLFDFESGDGGFVGTNDWQYGVPSTGPGAAYSGSNLIGTLINGAYTIGPLLSTMTSPPMALGQDPVLTFWHWYHTEGAYTPFDGGNVKISADGGSTWQIIVPADGYDGVLSTSFSNPIGGEEVFCGDHEMWQLETFDLYAYADQTVQIKFDYGSDTSVISGDGWYIDDIFIEFIHVGIEDEAALPNAFNLSQNYPNPFNANTQINFTIPTTSDVNLSVYNMLGQKVATLVSETLNAGNHSANWNASAVSSGVYFYKLTAGDKTEVQEMTLIK